MSFWKIPGWAKWDELEEEKHPHLWSGALRDPETDLYEIKKDEFVLYGPEEALLFRPKRGIFRVGMGLYAALLHIVSKRKT